MSTLKCDIKVSSVVLTQYYKIGFFFHWVQQIIANFDIWFLILQVCVMIHSGSRGLGHQVATG